MSMERRQKSIPVTREFPQALDAEVSVLGAMIQDPKAAQQAANILRPADFYLDRHRYVFEAALSCLAEDVTPDLVSVAERLQRAKRYQAVIEAGPLSDFVDRVPTVANIAHHARIVKDKARLRALMNAFASGFERAQANGKDPGAILSDFWEKTHDIEEEAEAASKPKPYEVLSAADYLQSSFTGSARLVPALGFTECGAGLVTGPGGHGKSLMALNLALAWTGVTLPISEAVPALRTLRVMLFQVEDAPGMVQERLRILLGSAPVPAGLFLFRRDEPMRFSGTRGCPNEAALDRLFATLQRHRPIDVVIFDPLVYLHEAEENSSSEMTRWLVPFREVCRRAGAAPLVVHHAGWMPDGEDARGRGSTAIRAWSDLELALRTQTRSGQTLHRLNLVKANFAPLWKDPLTLELDPDTLRFRAVDETGALCPPEALVAWLEEDHSGTWTGPRAELYAAIQKRFGCSDRTAWATVKQAKELGLLVDEGRQKPLRVANSPIDEGLRDFQSNSGTNSPELPI